MAHPAIHPGRNSRRERDFTSRSAPRVREDIEVIGTQVADAEDDSIAAGIRKGESVGREPAFSPLAPEFDVSIAQFLRCPT